MTLISFDANTRTITWYSPNVIAATTYTITITGTITTDVTYSSSLSFKLDMTMPSCASTLEAITLVPPTLNN